MSIGSESKYSIEYRRNYIKEQVKRLGGLGIIGVKSTTSIRSGGGAKRSMVCLSKSINQMCNVREQTYAWCTAKNILKNNNKIPTKLIEVMYIEYYYQCAVVYVCVNG
jgi:hypothetical protein